MDGYLQLQSGEYGRETGRNAWEETGRAPSLGAPGWRAQFGRVGITITPPGREAVPHASGQGAKRKITELNGFEVGFGVRGAPKGKSHEMGSKREQNAREPSVDLRAQRVLGGTKGVLAGTASAAAAEATAHTRGSRRVGAPASLWEGYCRTGLVSHPTPATAVRGDVPARWHRADRPGGGRSGPRGRDDQWASLRDVVMDAPSAHMEGTSGQAIAFGGLGVARTACRACNGGGPEG